MSSKKTVNKLSQKTLVDFDKSFGKFNMRHELPLKKTVEKKQFKKTLNKARRKFFIKLGLLGLLILLFLFILYLLTL
ncbi:MAG: hypothetical protein WC867_04465 [Candidatus Pacearchaeota archaeon]|jgi:hypothetical protein